MWMFHNNSTDNFTEDTMTAEEIWRERIMAQLEEADTRILKIVYYFIIGLKKREGRIGK